MTEELVLNYCPHGMQKLFHGCKVRYKAFVGGIGSGKTLAGSMEAIQYMCENPNSAGMIVAPNFPMLTKSTKPTLMDRLPSVLIKEVNKGEKYIELKNGARAYWASADDPESLRGINLSWFWIDEASLVSAMAWKIMLGRIRDDRFPCRAWVTTTPKGFNWVYREFVQKKRGSYELIHCSSKANPYLTSEFIDSLIESYSGSFAKQEIEGDFVAMEGLVFFNFSRHINQKDMKIDFDEGVVSATF